MIAAVSRGGVHCQQRPLGNVPYYNASDHHGMEKTSFGKKLTASLSCLMSRQMWSTTVQNWQLQLVYNVL